MIDRNSMLYWFPKVAGLSVPYPRTEMVEVSDKHQFIQYIDKPDKFPKKTLKTLKSAAAKIGYPLFMRTDQLSGKHSLFEWAPYVEREEKLLRHILMLVEESAMAGVLGLPINAFVFREFIELDAAFKAFSGMSIARERRYFIKDGAVQCHHPYWVEDAIQFWEKQKPENWKKLLAELNTETEEEIQILTKLASKIASVFEGYWSVDFARTSQRQWILIDMALGDQSWHPKCDK